MTTTKRQVDAMVAAARENGLSNESVARELANNAVQAIADDPDPSATLAAMINHRRFHWPHFWSSFTGAPRVLACAMVRAYKVCAMNDDN